MEDKRLEELIKIRREISVLTEKKNLIEEEIAASLECAAGKSKTHNVNCVKVTIKRPLYYKLDSEIWEGIKGNVPNDLQPIKIKEEVDPKGYEWLRENKPDVFNMVAKAVTLTDGKAQITIKE